MLQEFLIFFIELSASHKWPIKNLIIRINKLLFCFDITRSFDRNPMMFFFRCFPSTLELSLSLRLVASEARGWGRPDSPFLDLDLASALNAFLVHLFVFGVNTAGTTARNEMNGNASAG